MNPTSPVPVCINGGDRVRLPDGREGAVVVTKYSKVGKRTEFGIRVDGDNRLGVDTMILVFGDEAGLELLGAKKEHA
jgi:hypothetical protein